MSDPSQYEIDGAGRRWLTLPDGTRYEVAWQGGELMPPRAYVTTIGTLIRSAQAMGLAEEDESLARAA
jgi:hypothetical protein